MDSDTEAEGQSSVGNEGPIALGESDPSFLANLGRRVREAREQRGMARKVCRGLRLSRSDTSRSWKAGEGNASVILLRRVAAALGVQLTDLVDSAEPAAEQRLIRRFLDSLPPERSKRYCVD